MIILSSTRQCYGIRRDSEWPFSFCRLNGDHVRLVRFLSYPDHQIKSMRMDICLF